MSNDKLRLPFGMTVAQAKKNAKHIARKHGIPLHQAQDIVASQQGEDKGWARAIEHIRKLQELKIRTLAKWALKMTTSEQDLQLERFSSYGNVMVCGPDIRGNQAVMLYIARNWLEYRFHACVLVNGHLDYTSHTDQYKNWICMKMPQAQDDLDRLFDHILNMHVSRCIIDGAVPENAKHVRSHLMTGISTLFSVQTWGDDPVKEALDVLYDPHEQAHYRLPNIVHVEPEDGKFVVRRVFS